MEKPADPNDWERRFVAAMRRFFSCDARGWEEAATGDRVTVEEVRVEGTYPQSSVVVILRDSGRPTCTFGVRLSPWTEDGAYQGWMQPWPNPNPEWCGNFEARNLRSSLTVGLPEQCCAGEIVWYQASLNRRIDPAAWERRLRLALEDGLLDADELGVNPRTGGRVLGDAVWIEGAYPESRAMIVLRDEAQPECRFGWRVRVWRDSRRPTGEDSWGTPEQFAGIMLVHLQEFIAAGEGNLPDRCLPGEITWIRGTAGDYFE